MSDSPRADDDTDSRVERWHTSTADLGELHEYLGMTWDEYRRWVEHGTP